MFLKYPSITNDYHEKDIHRWIRHFPEIPTARYVIQEKIHGSNIQLVFTPSGELVICSRNQVIPDDDDFFGVRGVVESLRSKLETVQFLAKKLGQTIRLYGELFGPGIQKGVNYGNEKRILFFDIEVDGKWLSYLEFKVNMYSLGLSTLMVPVLGIANSLEEALKFDCNHNTTLYDGEPDGENIMEGVVIKPIEHVFRTPEGSTFYLKKKTAAFLDKKSKPRVRKDPKEGKSEAALQAREDFLAYVHDERVQSVFSKDGTIQSHKEIGKYIKLVMNDARETFFREEEFDVKDYAKDELNYIFNCGSIISDLLMKYL